MFTLEHLADDVAAAGYRLEFHGRYSHTRGAVERWLALSGLGCDVAHAELRMEAGIPVAGLVVRATKPLTESASR